MAFKMTCPVIAVMVGFIIVLCLLLSKYAGGKKPDRAAQMARRMALELEAGQAVGVMTLQDGTPISLAMKTERFPYMAAILTNISRAWRFTCFGAVLENKWVLTSAHCRLLGKQHRVLLLRSLSSKHSHTHRVHFWRVHDKFNETQHNAMYDIAIAKIVIDSHAVPAVAQFDDGPVNKAVACVWRTVLAMDKTAILTNEVDSFKLGFLRSTMCKRIYNVTLNRSLMCADLSGYKNCLVREFGPLFVGDKVVGIIARTPPRCNAKAAVFTNVSHYSKWIQRVTRK